MPGQKIPVDMVNFTDTFSYEENYKAELTDSISSRSSSPKSLLTDTDYSLSESSESPEGSIIFDFDGDAEKISNELDNMKITEIQAEEMMKEGLDMRYVLQAAWKLKPKITKKFKKGVKLNGSAVLKLLNFHYDEAEEEESQEDKLSRALAEFEKSLKKRVRAPPGFERGKTAAKQKEEILVSYANGTNTFSLASEPMTVHDITVSCMVDSCRGFIQQTNNPTFVGLHHLEDEMLSNYSLEAPRQLMRPIAPGSVVAAHSENKWYRCQVVSYNAELDTCDVKFVDHGGYTTIPAVDLQQLKSEFLRLPFQAIEVYFAHVKPAENEIEIDIASEILFHSTASLQLVGTAEDGIPVVQAYYYDGDFVQLFNQEVLDICMAEVPATLLTPASSLSSSPTTCSSAISTISSSEESDSPVSPLSVGETDVYYEDVLPHHPPVPVCPLTGQVYPTAGYVYTDEAGYQHVYYLQGPYVMMPLPTSSSPSPIPSDKSVLCEPSIESDIAAAKQQQQQGGYDFINKPYEEWTQEDYSRYYGDN